MAQLQKIMPVLLPVILTAFNGCTMTHLEGSGNVVRDDRSPGRFTAVDLRGMGSLIVRQGLVHQVVVHTDDNLLAHLVTDVHNGTLRIYTDIPVSHYTLMEIEVTMPDIQGLILSGSGNVEASGIITDELSINLSGSGNMNVDIECESMAVRLDGSGGINLAGTANRSKIKLDGSGTVTAFDLWAKNSVVSLDGSGWCRVHAEEHLRVTLNGSGQVVYSGNPVVIQNISGSGHIHSIGE